MLTLSDINTASNSKDGDIYSDLHKDVYGFRPRYVRFVSLEEFDADFERLVKQLDIQETEEAASQARNFTISKDEFDFYGLERLEYLFGLKFGSIAKWVSE